ncbi:MAG: alginate lyase family protein [Verrucomicrobiota bacterium]
MPALLVIGWGLIHILPACDLYLWDGKMICAAADAVAKSPPGTGLNPAYGKLIDEAEAAMLRGPFAVTDKTRLPPSGNLHDFCTLSPYFWPISWLPGGKPYYFRDGKVNPEAKSDAYDRERYFDLIQTMQTLALAYRFSGQEKYAKQGALLLRRWFLEEATAMNPNFEYAQAIPGWLAGSSLGVIRGSELVMILDASRLIEKSGHWTEQDEAGLKIWFSRYLDWVVNSDFGKKDGKRKNNHGTWHDVHITAIALYVGRKALARDVALSIPDNRLKRQINRLGEQKYELRRSRSWEYSLYNLRGLYAMATLAERLGIDLWNYQQDGVKPLEAASTFLAPYAAGKRQWPHHQLKKSDVWAKELGAVVFQQASQRYPSHGFTQALVCLDDLDATHRLRLLHARSKSPEVLASVIR